MQLVVHTVGLCITLPSSCMPEASHKDFTLLMSELLFIQTNKQTNKRTNERTNERTNKQTNERANKRTNGRTNTNKQTNKQTNKKTNKQTNKQTTRLWCCSPHARTYSSEKLPASSSLQFPKIFIGGIFIWMLGIWHETLINQTYQPCLALGMYQLKESQNYVPLWLTVIL